MRVIDEASNGGTVEVATGEPFRVQLSENPTTGYRWHLTLPADTALRIVEDSFEENSQHKPGAGGVRYWTLAADRLAVVRLQFERKRAWEKQAAEVFAVTIDVRAR